MKTSHLRVLGFSFMCLLTSAGWATESSFVVGQVAKFAAVTPNIYRGARPTAADLANLRSQYQIRADINLEDSASAVAADQSASSSLGISFLPTPLNPYAEPSDQDINGVLAELQDPRNFPVYVHCHYGEDRTGLVIGLYRVLVQGMPAAQAYQEMKSFGYHPGLKGLDNYFRQKTGYTGQ